MISREELLVKLQLCVDDPMWPDHVEMPKQLIRIVIEQLTRHAQRALSPDDDWEERGAADELRAFVIEQCAKAAEKEGSAGYISCEPQFENGYRLACEHAAKAIRALSAVTSTDGGSK